MARALDARTLRQIHDAHVKAVNNGTLTDIDSVYKYFMKGTLVWFNGVLRNDLGTLSYLLNYILCG